jgi:hypothetical protein
MEVGLARTPYSVLATPAAPSVAWARVRRNRLETSTICHGLMFWDKMVVPVVPALTMDGGLEIGATERTLMAEGRLILSNYQFMGYIQTMHADPSGLMHHGPQAKPFAETRAAEFLRLSAADRGRWTIGGDDDVLTLLVSDTSQGGILFELTNSIPIVTSVKDIEQYLRFLEARSDEKRRLSNTLDMLANRIANGSDPAEELKTTSREIASACSDLCKVTGENHGFELSSGRVSFSFSAARFLDWAGKATLAGDLLGLDDTATRMLGIAAGAVSQIRIAPSASRKLNSQHAAIFSTVLKLQYPGP